MIQDTKNLPQPIGVVFNTSMARPDAALALAALYVSSSRRDARVGGICVTGAGLDAAIFCDIVARFYGGQARVPSSNSALPIGLAVATPMPPSAPMVDAAIKRKRDDGMFQYTRTIQRMADTALADALLRNAITFSAESVVVLSAPATWLARSVELTGTIAQYKQRVKRVVIVEAGDVEQDRKALDTLVAALPVPVVRCGRNVGEDLSAPRAQIEGGFSWSPANPVGDAVRATGASPVPLHDVAALHYALHPTSGFFTVTDGRLAVEAGMREACLTALTALATSKPAAPPPRGGG
jgi:hypothetical protein